MTWFEAEQILHYLAGLENALEEWTLSRLQMQAEQAELQILAQKLAEASTGTPQTHQQHLLLQLCEQTQHCRQCIEERLKY